MPERRDWPPTVHELIAALRETSRPEPTADPERAGDEQEAARTAMLLGPRPCAICLLVDRSLYRGLRAWFAEFVNDPELRVRLRRSRGFCREHLTHLMQCGDALGVAILYADLVDEALQRTEPSPRRLWPRGEGRGSVVCPCCEAEAEAEQRYASALGAALGDRDVWRELEESSGLCCRHVDATVGFANREAASRLRTHHADRLRRLSEELTEFIRKNDYRFRSEPWGSERDSWRRAVALLRRR